MKRDCPKCGGVKALCIGVQYSPMDSYSYDGVSEWRCGNIDCDYRIGRWCGKVLGPEEVEPPFHEGNSLGHPRIQTI